MSVAYPAGLGGMSSSGDTNAAAGSGDNSNGGGDSNGPGGDQNGNGDSNGDSGGSSSDISVESSGDYYVVTGVLGSYSSDDSNDHIYTTTAYYDGTTLNVGTYATIFTGGSATYTSLAAGTSYTLSDGVTYTATEDKVTTINSDTFGFMIHQNSNYITIEAGTIVNSGYATFLVKSGSSSESVTATIDNAVISNGGVLIQVMDNDDATTGTTTSGFATTHTESSGFDTSSASSDGSVQSFTFTNGTYTGNIYNASGSDGLDATTLNVTLGTGAVLIGAAASTAAIHVTYDGSQVVKANGGDAYTTDNYTEILSYQNTSFTISEYWSIGQVANLVNSNGGNDINMTLENGAAWYVDGTSLITSLTMDSSSAVYRRGRVPHDWLHYIQRGGHADLRERQPDLHRGRGHDSGDRYRR